MKTFHIIGIFFLFFNQVFAETVHTVPGPGSTWKSVLEYNNFRNEESGASLSRRQEAYHVSRLHAGVPVFDGEVFGYKGSIQETSSGTVVYTDKCFEKVPQELLQSPPAVPNQCVWGVCNPPAPGESMQRKMIIFAELYMCEPKIGTYTFTSLRKENLPHFGDVVVGDAKVYFGPFSQTSWLSYILPGTGEVYAKSSTRETTYQDVKVSHVSTKTMKALTDFQVQLADQEEKSCLIVAFGDSLTEGMGATRLDAYPSKLSEEIGVPVCNMGLSGNTSEVAKQRVVEVIKLSPKVVIVGLGANDLLQGLSAKQTEENMTFIIDSLLKAGTSVVVLGFDGVVKPELAEVLTRTIDSFKGVDGLVYLPRAFVGVLDTPERISSDGMHPNAKGYQVLAKNISEDGFGLLKVIPWGN